MRYIRGIIFDLDGTLYDCPQLLSMQRKVAIEALRDFHHLDMESANRMFKRKRQELKKSLGFSPTTTATCIACGIPLDLYLAETTRRYDPADFLQHDDRLVMVLEELKKSHTLALISNNNRPHVDRMLKILGVASLFDASLTLSESKIVKPSTELYRRVCRKLSLDPVDCLAIGDRKEIDLFPAEALGMVTILVSGVQDVYELPFRIMELEKEE